MMRAPRFGFMDHFALWASLGAGLYLMPFGALLVPALSIEKALLATLLAGLLGGLLIASLSALASTTRRSTYDLLVEPFGDASKAPLALLLLVRHLVVATFALVLIADSAALISDRSLGAGARPVWVMACGAAARVVGLLGVGRVAMAMRRVGVWLILIIAIGIALSAYMEFEIPSYLRRPASGGWPSFWQAVDVMLIFPIIWLPVVADFARLGDKARSAASGSFAGIFLATVWFGVIGIVYLPATESGDIAGFLVGMQLGIGAMVLLFILQIDELFISANACVPTLEASGVTVARLAPAFAVLIAASAAIWLTVGDVEPYVPLLAAVFVPAFAVVLSRNLSPERGPAWVPALAWICGYLLYQWIAPAEIGWWRDIVSSPFQAAGLPFPASEAVTRLGAAIPSFTVAFCVDLALRSAVRFITVRPGAPQAV